MKKTFALALTLFAAACGDNNDGTETPQDGGPDESTPDMIVDPHDRGVVVTGNFATASTMAELDVDDIELTQTIGPAGAVGVDPVMRKIGNELFIVNRNTENSVTILAASDYSLVEQVGIGAGTNPQDVAVVGDKVYVATYGDKGLRVFTRGGTTATEIDLSADDPDGTPNCASVFAVGTKVFVACQLLDTSFTPRGDGKVYVVDTTTDLKVATLTLSTPNPFSLFAQLPTGSDHAGDLLIGTLDFADNNSGCLERVTTGAVPAAPGCLLSNADLGGFAQRLETNATTGYVVVARADFSGGDIRTFQISNSTLAATAFNPPEHHIVDVAVCPDGKIVAADKGTTTPGDKNGVRVYASNGTSLSEPQDIGMKPGSFWGLACYE